MSGTKKGGIKARETNLAKNPNFYKEIGKKGGLKSFGGGFTNNSALARRAGQLGGRATLADREARRGN